MISSASLRFLNCRTHFDRDLTCLFLFAENAAPAKGKKGGSQKNPNKKKGKKLTRREREALELSEAKAVPAGIPLGSLPLNVVKTPSSDFESPVAPSRCANRFSVLENLDGDISFCPEMTVSAPSPKIFTGENLFDALELVHDYCHNEWVDPEPSYAMSVAVPEVNVCIAPVSVASPEIFTAENLFDALELVDDYFHNDYVDIEADSSAMSVLVPEVEVCVAAPDEQGKHKDGWLIRAFKLVGKVVATVAAAAVAVVSVVRSCF